MNISQQYWMSSEEARLILEGLTKMTLSEAANRLIDNVVTVWETSAQPAGIFQITVEFVLDKEHVNE